MKTQKTDTLDEFMQARLGMQADVYLVLGIKLSGELVSYDEKALFIHGSGDVARPLQMVLWSAISTVSTRDESNPEWCSSRSLCSRLSRPRN